MSGSKGLQRYVPRILQDSGMIASSEVAHYTHLKLVQYVKADDIDAALRRAKAEGLDDAAKAICMYCNDPEWQKRDEDDNHESPYTRTMYPCAAYKIHDLIRELDACAAQIEEGEST